MAITPHSNQSIDAPARVVISAQVNNSVFSIAVSIGELHVKWPPRLTVALGLVAALAWLAPGSAQAVNKCTGADGQVAYQDAPCPISAKSSQEVKIRQNSIGTSDGSWRFERKKDALTGEIACFAMSPITTPKSPTVERFIPVHMIVLATPNSDVIALRTSDDSNLFHNDLQGMGVKTDNGPFIPFTVKSGSHVVGFGDGSAVIEALSKSNNLVVRARFWPYEKLHDMRPISSTGFDSALKQARACASR